MILASSFAYGMSALVSLPASARFAVRLASHGSSPIRGEFGNAQKGFGKIRDV